MVPKPPRRDSMAPSGSTNRLPVTAVRILRPISTILGRDPIDQPDSVGAVVPIRQFMAWASPYVKPGLPRWMIWLFFSLSLESLLLSLILVSNIVLERDGNGHQVLQHAYQSHPVVYLLTIGAGFIGSGVIFSIARSLFHMHPDRLQRGVLDDLAGRGLVQLVSEEESP